MVKILVHLIEQGMNVPWCTGLSCDNVAAYDDNQHLIFKKHFIVN